MKSNITVNGELWKLPTPTITDLEIFYCNPSEDTLQQHVYNCLPDNILNEVEEDYLLFGAVFEEYLSYIYKNIEAYPRVDTLTEVNLRMTEQEQNPNWTEASVAKRIADHKEKFKKAEQKDGNMIAFDRYLEGIREVNVNGDFLLWTKSVSQHSGLPMQQLMSLDYPDFIKLNNSMTIQNELEEAQRKSQAAKEAQQEMIKKAKGGR